MKKLINFLKSLFNLKKDFPLTHVQESEEIRLTYELHIKAIDTLLQTKPDILLYDVLDVSIDSHLETGIILKRILHTLSDTHKAKNVIQYKTIEWIIEDMLEAYSHNPSIKVREYQEAFMKAYCKKYVLL